MNKRLLIVAVALVLIAGAGLYWFQPWKLATDRHVDEALAVVPAASSSAALPAGSSPAALPAASGAAVAPEASASGPAVVRRGEFVSHEHDTAGQARVVRNVDGSHTLELVDLATSNGPDLRVWLSDQPVQAGAAGWRVFDDGKWVELGRLKGNKGNQRYAIPAGTDLEKLTSVAIWCKRFSVSFGAASLTPAGVSASG
ncbi:DM13 domain-containing protein [Actinoplanes sp. NPDC020271]|uniref:DM13 domain-containing protein n=1 Tax=Actinoplanes sp. NPDC020271 TaxID=3363896 RepID=UPI00378A24B5